MKKSTRILAGLIITTIGFVAAVPITLTYRLNHSMFTRIDPLRDFPVDVKYFGNVRVLKISGVHCDLIAADSFSFEMEKRIAPHTKMEQRGDTLIVSAAEPGGHIRILSKGLNIIAINSDVTVRGSYSPYDIASYSIELDSSKLYTQAIGSDYRIRQHIGNLSIAGTNNSSIDMAGTVRMGELSLHNITSIKIDRMVGASELKVEYDEPVMVKSHSQDGKMTVQVE